MTKARIFEETTLWTQTQKKSDSKELGNVFKVL